MLKVFLILPEKFKFSNSCSKLFLNNFRNTIEFYDGLIFEIFDTSGTYRFISGGRYDKLLKSLGSDEQLRAVGFATYNNEINKYLESKSNGQN